MTLQIKKHKDRFRCPSFLDYVRLQGCEDCKALGLVQRLRTTASHLISIKWAEGSDALAVPQCMQHHPQSSMSALVLLASHGVDIGALHRKLWNGFLFYTTGIVYEIKTQEEFENECTLLGLTEKTLSRRKNR